MPRQYSIDDIAKYKAGSGYGDWIANLMSIKEGGRMAPEYYIDGVPQYYKDVEEDYVEGSGATVTKFRYNVPESVIQFLQTNPNLFMHSVTICKRNSRNNTPDEVFFNIDATVGIHGHLHRQYILEKTSLGVIIYEGTKAFDIETPILGILVQAHVEYVEDLVMRRSNGTTWYVEDDDYSKEYVLLRLERLHVAINDQLANFIMTDGLVNGQPTQNPTQNPAPHRIITLPETDLVVEDLEEGGSGFGLENNILTNNKKMPKKKFGNTDTQLFEGMLGGSMHEMGFDEGLEGGAWHDWLSNLYDVIRKPKDALGKMPKPIWDHKNEYGSYGIVSIEICREPLSKGLQNIIDRASRGDLIKNLAKSPYEDLFHLYANVYLKNPLTGKTTSFRVEKNQRVEIFNKIVPPKGNSGKCMGVPNIPMKNGLPTIGWFKFWENTDNTTWEYSANRFNCQAFLKTRLETIGLLTPALKEFIMQDIDTILDPVKNKFQISVAKGITDFANIMQNIYKGGEMGGDGCGCESQCGCGTKKTKKKNQKGGWVEPHIHQVWPREGVGWTGEVRAQYTDPDFGKH